MPSRSALKGREKGTGSIYKDGKRWYLKVRLHGKSTSKMLRNADGTPCTNDRDARNAAKGYQQILLANDQEQMAVQIAEAKKLRKHSGLLLKDMWSKYLEQPERPDSAPTTLAKYESYCRMFQKWMTENHPEIDRISAVDKDIAREFLNDLWQSRISERTYNAYVQALRLIFKHLLEVAAMDVNPFQGIPHKTVATISRKEFSAEQVTAIFRGFEDGFFYETTVEKLGKERKRERFKVTRQFNPMNAEEMRVLLNLCCWTGCRGQDGCLMEWKNVDLSKSIISYIPRKTARKTGHKAVTLPLHPALEEALQRAWGWKNNNAEGEDYILPKIAHRYQKNPSGIQKDVMKIIHCATGLDTTEPFQATDGHRKLAANAYSLHSFRHTFVSFCANANVPLVVVAEIVGHGNPAMTKHYAHITTDSKRNAINALPILGHSNSTAQQGDSLWLQVQDALRSANEEQLKQVLALLAPSGQASIPAVLPESGQ